MSAAAQTPDLPAEYVTVEEYLAAELLSFEKHEYVDGKVRERAGSSGPHNVLAQNLGGIVYSQLRKTGCRFFGSDMKLKFALPDQRFYYPDGMILCDRSDFTQDFSSKPSVIFEILSEETRRIDEREKAPAFRAMESTEAYVLIEQERAEVTVVRRTGKGWEGHQYFGLEAVAELGVHGLVLPLAELYEDVVFPA